MKIKEVSLNDLTAIIIAGIVVSVALIVPSVPENIVPVITGFLGVIGGYVGARNLPQNTNDDDIEVTIEGA